MVLFIPAPQIEIGRKFHPVGIGGTSAGAIAASVTAAAEYRTRIGGGFSGFDLLGEVADELRTPGHLLSLYRTVRDTEHLFDLATVFPVGGDGFLLLCHRGFQPLAEVKRTPEGIFIDVIYLEI